jgi:hypothetical protein
MIPDKSDPPTSPLPALAALERRATVVPPPNNLPYIVTVALMAMFAVASVVAVTLIRPTQDNSSLITTILGFIATTTASLLAFMKSQETHLSVNSRLDAFMRNAEMAAHIQGLAEGQVKGRQDANARTDALTAGPVVTITPSTNIPT